MQYQPVLLHDQQIPTAGLSAQGTRLMESRILAESVNHLSIMSGEAGLKS